MALYKRGAIWWMRFTGPDGRERRETTRTPDKRQAQQLHDIRKAAAWRHRRANKAWGDLFDRLEPPF